MKKFIYGILSVYLVFGSSVFAATYNAGILPAVSMTYRVNVLPKPKSNGFGASLSTANAEAPRADLVKGYLLSSVSYSLRNGDSIASVQSFKMDDFNLSETMDFSFKQSGAGLLMGQQAPTKMDLVYYINGYPILKWSGECKYYNGSKDTVCSLSAGSVFGGLPAGKYSVILYYGSAYYLLQFTLNSK